MSFESIMHKLIFRGEKRSKSFDHVQDNLIRRASPSTEAFIKLGKYHSLERRGVLAVPFQDDCRGNSEFDFKYFAF